MVKPRLKQHDKKQRLTYQDKLLIKQNAQSRGEQGKCIQEVDFYNSSKEQNLIAPYFRCSTSTSSSINSGCLRYFGRGKGAQKSRNQILNFRRI
uniref:Ribosomal protein S16 n=1 Tax=Pyrrosia lingua TaxID=187374 RepID=A0A6M4B3K0_9MONI|nr:ribosomal protein S16 [Pyrrosia lingua]QJQ36755.1 ribosomal protein S16 [Pyrrosia lingua]